MYVHGAAAFSIAHPTSSLCITITRVVSRFLTETHPFARGGVPKPHYESRKRTSLRVAMSMNRWPSRSRILQVHYQYCLYHFFSSRVQFSHETASLRRSCHENAPLGGWSCHKKAPLRGWSCPWVAGPPGRACGSRHPRP